MIKETLSYGLVMLVENTITLTLIADVFYRVSLKVYALRHPHVVWPSGVLLLAFVGLFWIFNLSEFYTCYVNYLVKCNPVEIVTVASRVFSRSIMLLMAILFWYYKVKVPKLELFK